MADIPYARWYSDGTVAYTKGSTAITGTNTFWLSAGIKAGDIFVDPNGKIYEITAVNDSTSITLGKSYAGDTGTGKGYSIIRNFNGTMSPTLAKRVSILLNEFEQRYDLDMKTVTPKSAYDIAKDNGFTGTDAEWLDSLTAYGVAVKNGYTGTAEEWLESLKAAGEWSKLDARTNILTSTTWGYRNCMFRGKKLGTSISDAQYEAIQNRSFKDIMLGDYWVINNKYYYVAHFTESNNTRSAYSHGDPGVIIVTSRMGNYPMNSEDNTTGGFPATTMFKETIPALVEERIDPDFRGLAKLHYEHINSDNVWGCPVQIKANLIRYEQLFGSLWNGYFGIKCPMHYKKRFAMFNFSLPGPNSAIPGVILTGEGKPIWLATKADATHWLSIFDNHEGDWNSKYIAATSAEGVVLYFIV